jgi:hypothetical protein
MQTAVFGHTWCKPDIGPAPRHIGRHGDLAGLTGARNDLGILLVLPRVEQLMLDTGGC